MRALLPSLSVSFVPDVHLNFRLFHTPSHSHAKSESLVNAKVNAPDSEAIRRRNKIIAPWQKLHAFTYTFLLFERPLIKKFLCIEVSVPQTITTPLSCLLPQAGTAHGTQSNNKHMWWGGCWRGSETLFCSPRLLR